MKTLKLFACACLINLSCFAQDSTQSSATSIETRIPILDELFITNNGQKWGVVDTSGNVIIPFECDGIVQVSDSTCIASTYIKSYPLPTGLERYQYEGVYFYFDQQGRLEDREEEPFALMVEYEGMHDLRYVVSRGPFYFVPDMDGDTVVKRPMDQLNVRPRMVLHTRNGSN